MKTISVSKRSKTLKQLLKMAQRSDLILQSTDGAQFFLARISGTQAFYVGDDDDFEQEVAATRKNKRLMKFLDERRARAKDRKGTPLAEVKRQLGL